MWFFVLFYSSMSLLGKLCLLVRVRMETPMVHLHEAQHEGRLL